MASGPTRGSTMAAAPANPPMTTTRARAARSGRRENSPIDERSRSLQRSDPGIVASTPTLSWGQARTQSRQNVQSMFPAFCGMYKSSSHPRCCALPRRQSCVAQVAQTRPLLQPHLERRDERAHEMELPDRADVLAEAGAAEQRVDDEGADEIGDDDPGGPERAVPQRERLVGPEEERQQDDGQPLRSQRRGASGAWRVRDGVPARAAA